jgi:hypothetical protein
VRGVGAHGGNRDELSELAAPRLVQQSLVHGARLYASSAPRGRDVPLRPRR